MFIQLDVWLLCVFYSYYSPFSCISIKYLSVSVFLLFFYLVTLCLLHSNMAYLSLKEENTSNKYELNRIKSNITAFEALLYKGKGYNLPTRESIMFFKGDNKKLPTVTVISNPYCYHCSEIHYKIGKLIKLGFSIQYIMTAFNEELILTNELILSYYLKYGGLKTWKALSDWFESDKSDPHSIFNNLSISKNAIQKTKEQILWVKNSGIVSTPTVLVDRYKMPDYYNLENLEELYLF